MAVTVPSPAIVQFKTKINYKLYNFNITKNMKTEALTSTRTTPIQSEIDNINSQLGRIEKSIITALDTFRRFDLPANNLNPEDYFRNRPIAGQVESLVKTNHEMGSDSAYIKSGHVLKLSELCQYANSIELQVNSFLEDHIIPVVNFFEKNI